MPDSIDQRLRSMPIGTEIGVRLLDGTTISGEIAGFDREALRLVGHRRPIPFLAIAEVARRVTTEPPE